MKLGALKRWAGRLLKSRRDSVTKSDLVSMYLSLTNTRGQHTPELLQNRQRRNGRSSHNRERV